VHPGGFTVVAGLGQHLPVTTSAGTHVVTMRKTSVGGLQTGVLIDAVVSAGVHGTLAAAAIDQGAGLPITGTPPTGQGCSPSALAAAFLTRV
jgi:hypothetical protein